MMATPEPGKEHAMELEHLLTKAACEETVLAFSMRWTRAGTRPPPR